MADLSVLIRLHKHELDEKRRVLSGLYGDLALLEKQRVELERAFALEKAALEESAADMHFTFASYAEGVRKKREQIIEAERALEKSIETAKDSLMETFGELKKYEMTQEERDRLEEEERRLKEGRMLDEIGLEGFRRKDNRE